MVLKKIIDNKIVYGVIIFAFGIFLFGCNSAYAASLYFSPSSGNQTAGNILNVNVLVNTQGKVINNADAVIRFPANILEAVSISKTGSIFSLWVEEPAFSNSAGTISLNGGLPTPGSPVPPEKVDIMPLGAKTAVSSPFAFIWEGNRGRFPIKAILAIL